MSTLFLSMIQMVLQDLQPVYKLPYIAKTQLLFGLLGGKTTLILLPLPLPNIATPNLNWMIQQTHVFSRKTFSLLFINKT
jgi:hypothetical protein